MLSEQRASEVATGVDVYTCMEHAAGILHLIGDNPQEPVHTFGVGTLRDKTGGIVMGTLLAAAQFLSVLGQEELSQALIAYTDKIAHEGLQ